MPRDYASYVWVTYKRIVTDDSPARQTFLHGPRGNGARLPEADLSLMGTSWK